MNIIYTRRSSPRHDGDSFDCDLCGALPAAIEVRYSEPPLINPEQLGRSLVWYCSDCAAKRPEVVLAMLEMGVK